MNLEQLSAVQSPFWIIACVLLGVVAAVALYYRSNHLEDAPSWVRTVSPILRGTLVSVLAMLLLQFFLQKRINTTQKPSFAVLVDNSASVKNHFKDNNATSFIQSLNTLKGKLNEHFEVKTYSFGDKIALEQDSFSFNDKITNLNEVITEVLENEDPQLLKGMMLFSDGIINEGSTPTYLAEKSLVPIHTVLLGDTTIQKDLAISKIFYNKIAYKGDKVSLLVDVIGTNSKLQNSALKVLDENGRVLSSKPIRIDNTDFFKTEEFILPIDKEGVAKFRMALTPIAGEVTNANNYKTIFIEVLDARKKIVIVANSPHPDLGMLKSKIETSKNAEVDIVLAKDFQWPKEKIDLLILHQLPSVKNGINNVLTNAQKARTPIWYIVGMQSSVNSLNGVQEVVSFRGSGTQTNEVLPVLNNQFSLFSIDSLQQGQSNLSPLITPFGEWKLGPDAEVLLDQQVKKIKTDYPLIALSKKQPRTAVLTAEGIWKWRLSEELLGNQDFVSAIVLKTVQYLTVQEDTRRFQTAQSKTVYNENEKITLDALLYNASYEPTNEPEVNLELKNTEGEAFQYTFSRTSNAYSLNLGSLPPSSYTYVASTEYSQEKLTSGGRFVVNALDLESINLTANQQLMMSLSKLSGGQSISVDSLSLFSSSLGNTNTGKPIVFSEVQAKNILSLPWIMAILLALLCVEWILRRYYGSY